MSRVQLEHLTRGTWIVVSVTTATAAERFLARLRERDRGLWRVVKKS